METKSKGKKEKENKNGWKEKKKGGNKKENSKWKYWMKNIRSQIME